MSLIHTRPLPLRSQYLPQMFLHVVDIIPHEPIQRDRFTLTKTVRGDLVKIVFVTQLQPRFLGRAGHQVQDVLIV